MMKKTHWYPDDSKPGSVEGYPMTACGRDGGILRRGLITSFFGILKPEHRCSQCYKRFLERCNRKVRYMNFDHWWRLNAHKIFDASYYTTLSAWFDLKSKAKEIWDAAQEQQREESDEEFLYFREDGDYD